MRAGSIFYPIAEIFGVGILCLVIPAAIILVLAHWPELTGIYPWRKKVATHRAGERAASSSHLGTSHGSHLHNGGVNNR